MEEKFEIMNLLKSKQILEHELNSLAYGAVEIRENKIILFLDNDTEIDISI